uniref:Uncharacterized protein n=1 Tax=Amphimedon queenslandica TaxID=400682 RepID=A0A1X7VIP2_AMPQE
MRETLKEECKYCKKKIDFSLQRHFDASLKNNDEQCVADPFTSIASPVLQELSINDHGITQEGTSTEIRTNADFVKQISKTVNDDFEFDMIVRRSNVLLNALQQMQKATFDPRKRLNVMFVRTAGVCCGRIDKGVSEAHQP